jgi:hypothetical protein
MSIDDLESRLPESILLEIEKYFQTQNQGVSKQDIQLIVGNLENLLRINLQSMQNSSNSQPPVLSQEQIIPNATSFPCYR